ncbi:MAG: hypothetical protein HY815_16295, partial [Candidatus Riflebacteria bacterium]|nr:hypothetical protein [Candidatus Riflebacteria bacterium]
GLVRDVARRSFPTYTLLDPIPVSRPDLIAHLIVHVESPTAVEEVDVTTLGIDVSTDEESIRSNLWCYDVFAPSDKAQEAPLVSVWVPPATQGSGSGRSSGRVRVFGGPLDVSATLGAVEQELAARRAARAGRSSGGARSALATLTRNLDLLIVIVTLLALPLAIRRLWRYLMRHRRRCGACGMIMDYFPLVAVPGTGADPVVERILAFDGLTTIESRRESLEAIVGYRNTVPGARSLDPKSGLSMWGLWCQRCEEGVLASELKKNGSIVDEGEMPLKSLDSRTMMEQVSGGW